MSDENNRLSDAEMIAFRELLKKNGEELDQKFESDLEKMMIDNRSLRLSETWNGVAVIDGVSVEYYVDEDEKMIEFETQPSHALITHQFIKHVEGAHAVVVD